MLHHAFPGRSLRFRPAVPRLSRRTRLLSLPFAIIAVMTCGEATGPFDGVSIELPIEVWFSVLTRHSIRRGSFDTVRALVRHIHRGCRTQHERERRGSVIASRTKCAQR